MDRPILHAAVAIAVLSWAAPATRAQNTTDTFTNGTNIGGWTYGLPQAYPSTGGSPGFYLRTGGLDTIAPMLRTVGASAFTGDYRGRHVALVGVDLKLFAVDFSAGGRPLSPVLISFNGTPGNPDDDWGAYILGTQNIPLVGQDWQSYSFTIPSQSATLPAGWVFIQFGSTSPANPSWSTLMSAVDRLEFFYGNPENFFIFQMWDVGADNPRIMIAPPPCRADADENGLIEPADVATFVSRWLTSLTGGGLAGDFDGDGQVLPADVAAFVSAWLSALGGVC